MMAIEPQFPWSRRAGRSLAGVFVFLVVTLECGFAANWADDTSFVKTPENQPLHYRVLPAKLPVDRKLAPGFMSWLHRSLRVEKVRAALGVLFDDLRGESVLSAEGLRSRLEKLGAGFEVFSKLSSESRPALERVLFLVQACSAPSVVEFGRRFEGEDDRVDFQDPVVLLKRQNERLGEALRVLGLCSRGPSPNSQASQLPVAGVRSTHGQRLRPLSQKESTADDNDLGTQDLGTQRQEGISSEAIYRDDAAAGSLKEPVPHGVAKDAAEEDIIRERVGDVISTELNELTKEGIENEVPKEDFEDEALKEGRGGGVSKEGCGDGVAEVGFGLDGAGDGIPVDDAIHHGGADAGGGTDLLESESNQQESPQSGGGNGEELVAVAEKKDSVAKNKKLRSPKDLAVFLRREMEEFRLTFAALASELARYIRGCDAAQITSFRVFVWGKLKQVLRRLLQLHGASPQQHFRVRLNLRMIGDRIDLLQGVDDGFLMATVELNRIKYGTDRYSGDDFEGDSQRRTKSTDKRNDGAADLAKHTQLESWEAPAVQDFFRGSRVFIDDSTKRKLGLEGRSQRVKAQRN